MKKSELILLKISLIKRLRNLQKYQNSFRILKIYELEKNIKTIEKKLKS